MEVIATGGSIATATTGPGNGTGPAEPSIGLSTVSGGGCTLNPSAGFDVTLPMMFVLSISCMVWNYGRKR